MSTKAEVLRIDLTTSVKHVLEDGFVAAKGDWTQVSFEDLAQRAVNVFAVFLDEIYKSGGEIPDIKRLNGIDE